MEELQLVTKQVFMLIVAVVGCIAVTTDLLRMLRYVHKEGHSLFFFENNTGELRVIVLSLKVEHQERLQSLTATTANPKIS
jgi:hypothetical protein